MRRNWDIFCRVIDNFGDIGICWRLARQLAAEHGFAVRLWLDDPAALAPLCPPFNPMLPAQNLAGVNVCRWGEPFPAVEPADVVIEAFACELPAGYRAAMARRPAPPAWINLEYLSAETWIEGCHRLTSPQPPLRKHFFFPGFTARTGGLLRESHLLAARDELQASQQRGATLQVSLFCYDNAPVADLFAAWQASPRPIRCRVPPGQPLAATQRALGDRGPWQRGALSVTPIPFLAQDEYERLLWLCDVNFVRGEDSFVRAQWAGRPFVWQPYRQQEDTHLDKLAAFLARYTQALPVEAGVAVQRMFKAWNADPATPGEIAAAWAEFAAQLPALEVANRHWAESLCAQGDLAANLVEFVDSGL